MKRCYLIRHAETSWNQENRLQGRSDIPLSPLGAEQARRLGLCFACRALRGIFTSALARSRMTAQAIARGNGHALEPVIEPRLGEMHLGMWEGLTPEEIDARFDGGYGRWKRAPSAVTIPGAEPTAAFRVRVREALARILGAAGEGEYAIISHGGVIAAMLADMLDADYDTLLLQLRLDNAGVTAIEFGAGSAHVLWVNSTAHLLDPPLSIGPPAESFDCAQDSALSEVERAEPFDQHRVEGSALSGLGRAEPPPGLPSATRGGTPAA